MIDEKRSLKTYKEVLKLKINISDMFDHMQDLAPDINISETNKFDAASKRIKEQTFKKIHDKNADIPRTR